MNHNVRLYEFGPIVIIVINDRKEGKTQRVDSSGPTTSTTHYIHHLGATV